MNAKQTFSTLVQLAISLPMFYVTYWSWMIIAMASQMAFLSIVLAFLISAVLASVLVFGIGRGMGLDGRFKSTLIGAGIGAVIGGALFIPFLYHSLVFVFASLPLLGAIIAYQWSAWDTA